MTVLTTCIWTGFKVRYDSASNRVAFPTLVPTVQCTRTPSRGLNVSRPFLTVNHTCQAYVKSDLERHHGDLWSFHGHESRETCRSWRSSNKYSRLATTGKIQRTRFEKKLCRLFAKNILAALHSSLFHAR